MSFKLAQKRMVTWPVTIAIPQDGGGVTKATFHATFNVLTQEELEKIPGSDNPDLLDNVLADWKGVLEEDNAEMPFNADNKKKLLGITYVRAALYAAYAEVQQGRAAARKN